jgi:NADH-quinone oxidoreductase subunit A
MNPEFLTVLVFTTIGGGFVFASLLAGAFIRPKVKNAEKETIYECGERPFSSAWFNFNPRFYIVALIFIVFDVALAMLFPPLSVVSEIAGSSGQWIIAGAVLFFLGILALGLTYVWGKGDLEWIKK